MSVRMRHTRAHTNNRRSHHALDGVKSVVDRETGKRRLPHTVDEATGMYRGKQIAAPKTAKVKRVSETHGADTTPKGEHEHTHDHAHADHTNAEVLASKGVAGKVETGGRPKARSGFGGGA